MVEMKKKALVIGAGIGGLATAMALSHTGWDVEVFEKHDELRETGAGIGLMRNATAAVAALGIDIDWSRYGQVMRSFHVLDRGGELMRRMPVGADPDADTPQSINLHRRRLQQALLDQCANVTISTGHTLRAFSEDENSVTAEFENGRTVTGDVLVGADGMWSVVREALNGPSETREPGYDCWLGTADLPGDLLEQGHVEHFWGAGRRVGIIDIGHGKAYWWATANTKSLPELSGDHHADITRILDGWPELVGRLVETTEPKDVLRVPARDRTVAKVWGKGRVTMVGDAAHVMLTSLSQGGGMAIEDGVELAIRLQETVQQDATATVPECLRRYEKSRRKRVSGIHSKTSAMSRLEQFEHPVLRRLRDAYVRHTPQFLMERTMDDILSLPEGIVGSATVGGVIAGSQSASQLK